MDLCQSNGDCVGTAVVCDDSIARTVDTCLVGTGSCDFNTNSCECTSVGECDDGNGCTTDRCQADYTCANSPDIGASCEDGDAAGGTELSSISYWWGATITPSSPADITFPRYLTLSIAAVTGSLNLFSAGDEITNTGNVLRLY